MILNLDDLLATTKDAATGLMTLIKPDDNTITYESLSALARERAAMIAGLIENQALKDMIIDARTRNGSSPDLIEGITVAIMNDLAPLILAQRTNIEPNTLELRGRLIQLVDEYVNDVQSGCRTVEEMRMEIAGCLLLTAGLAVVDHSFADAPKVKAFRRVLEDYDNQGIGPDEMTDAQWTHCAEHIVGIRQDVLASF